MIVFAIFMSCETDIQLIRDPNNAGPQEPPLLIDNDNYLKNWFLPNVINMKSDPPMPPGASSTPWDRLDTLMIFASSDQESALINHVDSISIDNPGCAFIQWLGFECNNMDSVRYSGNLSPNEIEELDRLIVLYVDGLDK